MGIPGAIAIAAASCSGDSPTTPSGGIEGTVKEVSSSTPISGVIVTCAGITATTKADGTYALAGVLSGTQTLEATKTDYEPFSQSVSVSANSVISVDIAMTYSPSGITLLTGAVTNSTGQPVSGAKVSVAGLSDFTDSRGTYQLPNVPQGQRMIEISAEYYRTFNQSLFLASADRRFDVILTAELLPAPDDLQIASTVTRRVDLSWSYYSAPTLSGFRISRSNAEQGPYADLATVTGFSYADANANPDAIQYYRVAAVNLEQQTGNDLSAHILPTIALREVHTYSLTYPSDPTAIAVYAGTVFICGDRNIVYKYDTGFALKGTSILSIGEAGRTIRGIACDGTYVYVMTADWFPSTLYKYDFATMNQQGISGAFDGGCDALSFAEGSVWASLTNFPRHLCKIGNIAPNGAISVSQCKDSYNIANALWDGVRAWHFISGNRSFGRTPLPIDYSLGERYYLDYLASAMAWSGSTLYICSRADGGGTIVHQLTSQ